MAVKDSVEAENNAVRALSELMFGVKGPYEDSVDRRSDQYA